MRRRSHGFYASPTAIFLAFILLFLTCVSVPFAQGIRLFTLVDRHTGGSIRFGLWGYCLPKGIHGYPPCTMPELGWTFNNIPTLTGLEDTISPRLTGSLLVHLIVTTAVFLIFVLTTVFVSKRSLQRKIGANLWRSSSLKVVVTASNLVAAVLASTAFVIDLVVIGSVKAHVRQATGTAKNMKAYTGAITWLSLVAAVILWSSTIMLCLLSKERRSNARTSMDDSGTMYDSDASSRREESDPRSFRSSYSRKASDYHSVRSRTASAYNSRDEDEGRSVASRDVHSRRSTSLNEHESDRSGRNKQGFLASLCPCLRRDKDKDRDPSAEDIELATVRSSRSSRTTAGYRPSSEDLRRRKSRSVTAVEYGDRSGVPEEEYGSTADDASRYSEPGGAMYVPDEHGSEQSRSRTLSTSYASTEHSDGSFTEEDSEVTRVSSSTSAIGDSTLKSSSAPVAEINSNNESMTQTKSMSASRRSGSLEPESERGEENYVSDSGQESLDDTGSEDSGTDYVSQLSASSPDELQSGVPYATEQERSRAPEDHSGLVGSDSNLRQTPLDSGSEMSYVGTEDDADSILSQETPSYATSEAEDLSDNETDGDGSESTPFAETVLSTERSRDVLNTLEEGEDKELRETNVVTEPGRGDSFSISDQGSPVISGSEGTEPSASQISPLPAHSEAGLGSNVASENRYSDMPSSVVGLSEEQQLSYASVTEPDSDTEVSREISVIPPSPSDEGEDSVGSHQEPPFESEIQSELLSKSRSLGDVDEQLSGSSRHSSVSSGSDEESDEEEVDSDSASPSRTVSQDSDDNISRNTVPTADYASDVRSQYGTVHDDTPPFQSQSMMPDTRSDTAVYEQSSRSPSRSYPATQYDDRSSPGDVSRTDSNQDGLTRGYASPLSSPPYPGQDRYSGDNTTVPRSPSYPNQDGLGMPPDDELNSGGTSLLHSGQDKVTRSHTPPPASLPYPEQNSGGYTNVSPSHSNRDALTTSPDDKFGSGTTSPLYSNQDRITGGSTSPRASSPYPNQDNGGSTTAPRSPSYSNQGGLAMTPDDKLDSGRTSPPHSSQDRATGSYTPSLASPSHPEQDSRGYTTVPRSRYFSNQDSRTTPPADKFDSGGMLPLHSSQDRATRSYTPPAASSPYPNQDSVDYSTVPRSPSYSNEGALSTPPGDELDSGGTSPLHSSQGRVTGGNTSLPPSSPYPVQDGYSGGHTSVPRSPSYSNRDSLSTAQGDEFDSGGSSPLHSSQDRATSDRTPPPASPFHPEQDSRGYTTVPRSPPYSNQDGLTMPPADKSDSGGTLPLYSSQDRATGSYTPPSASSAYPNQDSGDCTTVPCSPPYSNQDSLSTLDEEADSGGTSLLHSSQDRVTGTPPTASPSHPEQDSRCYTTVPCSPSYSNQDSVSTPSGDEFDSGETSPLHFSQDRVTGGNTSAPASSPYPNQDSGGYTGVPRSPSHSGRGSLTAPPDDNFDSGGTSTLHPNQDRVTGYSPLASSSPYPDQDRYSGGCTTIPGSPYSGQDSLTGGYTTPPNDDPGGTSPLRPSQDRVTGGYTSPPASSPFPDQGSGDYATVPRSPSYSNQDALSMPPGNEFDSGGTSTLQSSQDRVAGGYIPPPASLPHPDQDSRGYSTVPRSPSYSNRDSLSMPPGDEFDSGGSSPLHSSQGRVTGGYTPLPASLSHPEQDSRDYTSVPRSPPYSNRDNLTTPPDDKLGSEGTSPLYSNQDRVNGGYTSQPASPYPEQDSGGYTTVPRSPSYPNRDSLTMLPGDESGSRRTSPLYSNRDRATRGDASLPASSLHPEQGKYRGDNTSLPYSPSYSNRDSLATSPDDKFDSGRMSPLYSNQDGVTGGYTSSPASPPYSNQDRYTRSYSTVPGPPSYSNQAGGYASPPASSPYSYRDRYTGAYTTVPGSPPYPNRDSFAGAYTSGSPALSDTERDPSDGFYSGSSAPHDLGSSRQRSNGFVSEAQTSPGDFASRITTPRSSSNIYSGPDFNQGYRTDSAPAVEPTGRRDTDSSLPGQRYSHPSPTSSPDYENYHNSDTDTNRRISGGTIPERRRSSGPYYSDDKFSGSAPYRTADRPEDWHSSAGPGRSSADSASDRWSSRRDYTYEGNSLSEGFGNGYAQSETQPKSNRPSFGSDSGRSSSSPISTVRESSLGDTDYPEGSFLRDSNDPVPDDSGKDVSDRTNPGRKESDHICSWCEDDSPTEGAQSIAVEGSSTKVPEGEDIRRICEICGAYIYA